MSLYDFSAKFNIPDLPVSICDFLGHYLHNQRFRKIGGRQGSSDDPRIPFDDVKIWHLVQIQNFSSDGGLRIPQRLSAAPPSDSWPFGRYDTAIFREDVEGGPQTPGHGFDGQLHFKPSFHALTPWIGFFVGQIRCIFYPHWQLETRLPLYLAYVHRFDIVPQLHAPRGQRSIPDPITGMYVLKRAKRSSGAPMGAIVPLYHCYMPVQLIPRFGAKADRRLDHPLSTMEFTQEFFLNHYFDMEDFFLLCRTL